MQESLLGSYIGLQLIFFYLHGVAWDRLPGLYQSCALGCAIDPAVQPDGPAQAVQDL